MLTGIRTAGNRLALSVMADAEAGAGVASEAEVVMVSMFFARSAACL